MAESVGEQVFVLQPTSPPVDTNLMELLALNFEQLNKDLTLVKKRSGDHNLLGFALQLGTLRYLSFIPDDFPQLPLKVVEYVAQQLKVSADAIALIVDKSSLNCRQIFRRVKQHLQNHRSRFVPSLQQQEQLTEKFIDACQLGDLPGLIDLLTADITVYLDGGGKVSSLLKPMQGATKVARFLIALRRSKLIPNYNLELIRVNGQLGIIYTIDGSVQSVVTFEFIDCRIRSIYFVRNPDKLRHIANSFSNQTLQSSSS